MNTIQTEFSDIPDLMKFNFRGDLFLRYDSGYKDEERILFFASDFSLNYLNENKVWILDGTFKSVPKEFGQLISIHSYIFGKTFPLAYVLLKSKTQATYIKAFKILASKIASEPKFIIIDFEKALYNALREVFPSSRQSACMFHLGQSIWRKVQELGLTSKYKSNLRLRKVVRMLLNLCFFKLETVESEFYNISQYCEKNQINDVKELIVYFKRIYIRNDNNHISNYVPLHPMEFWNVSERIVYNLPRTTNGVEGWHRALNNKAHIAHPNMMKFFELLKSEEEKVFCKLIKYSYGVLGLPGSVTLPFE